MTTDDDIALKDLVSQTLDARGVLPKIRAELRANVFLALEDTGDLKKFSNGELGQFVKTDNGCLVLNLVREFLSFYGLDFTLSVLDPESRCGLDYSGMGRDALMRRLNLSGNEGMPVLCQVLSGKREETTLSPVGLNSTYTKAVDEIDTGKGVEEEEEEVYSVATESISEASFKEESESAEKSGRVTPTKEQNESINLLTFTPVQEVRTVPKEKIEEIPKKGGLSLNDLPPLGPPVPPGGKKNIAEIRKRLEEGFADDSNNSDASKSSKNSSDTIQDDEDINDLLHSNDSSESKLTADETVSKITNLDHMESV